MASFSGLRGLAEVAGWPANLTWLLPVTVDAYAMTSARVGLAATTRSRRARRFAAANALGAITSSIAGNAAFHAVGTGLLAVSWPIVVAVGAVPAAVLGLTAHLHALRTHTGPGPEPADGNRPTPETRSRTPRPSRKHPRYPSEAELLDAAHAADRRYRNKYGRPITRDALRAALRISGPRATELRRRLTTPASSATPPAQIADAKEVPTQP